ncbi:MAG: BF3164 family lipoprotein [Bacteroidia bacterium]
MRRNQRETHWDLYSIIILAMTFLCLIGIGCRYSPQKVSKADLTDTIDRYTVEDFGNAQVLKAESLGLTKSMHPETRNIYMIGDRYLVYDGFFQDYHAHIVDLNTKEVFPFGKDGSQEGRVTSLIHFDFRASDRTLWGLDARRSAWIGYKLDSILASKTEQAFVKEIKIDIDAPKQVQWLNDTSLVLLSLVDSRGRVFVSNLEGEIQEISEKLPPKRDKSISDFVHPQAHQGHLVSHPQRSSLFFSSRYQDLSYIFKIADGIPKIAITRKGPKRFEAQWEQYDLGEYMAFLTTPKTTEIATDISCNAQNLYLLYSGKIAKGMPKEESLREWYTSLCKEILVFDWDGTPKSYYRLEEDAIDIASDSSGRFIYAVSFRTPDIVRYSID